MILEKPLEAISMIRYGTVRLGDPVLLPAGYSISRWSALPRKNGQDRTVVWIPSTSGNVPYIVNTDALALAI